MFECMEIVEKIYEGVVKTFYKKTTKVDDNRSGHRKQKRGESALKHFYSGVGKCTDKRKQRYIYLPRY